MAKVKFTVTKTFLDKHPKYMFVFGDNVLREGRRGAAVLRDHIRAYGFVTKRSPVRHEWAHYTIDEFKTVYRHEMNRLKEEMLRRPDSIFLISPVGSGLANRFGIWEKVIEPNIENDLREFENVVFLWKDVEETADGLVNAEETEEPAEKECASDESKDKDTE